MSDQQQLQQLQQKYQSVLGLIPQLGIRLQNQHLQNGKLFLRGEAPSEEAKNRLWNEIKRVDSSYHDLTADITVAAAAGTQPMTQTAGAAAGGGQGQRTYKVRPGDSLSKLAQQFYGNAADYMRIFDANRDRLSHPDKIRAGQELIIPE